MLSAKTRQEEEEEENNGASLLSKDVARDETGEEIITADEPACADDEKLG